MKKLILLSLALWVSSFSFAQRPAPTAADSLRDEGQLHLALIEHAKTFKENPDDRNNVYNYACAFALMRQRDSAFHYLHLAIQNDSSVQALNDPDFYFLLEDDRWSEVENDLVERVEAKHGKYSNVELSKELWRMKIKDQAFYYHIRVAEKNLGRESPIIWGLWETKAQINHDNLQRIEEIIAEHGWPKRSVVKGSAASTVFLIIQHADIEVQKKYLPVMTEAANEGEASWSSLALLIDRVNLREGKKQIYGSQITRGEDGKYMVDDLEEPAYVNQRRKEVGLGPIEDYVKRWNIEWTVEQKTK